MYNTFLFWSLKMARVTVEDCLDKIPNRFALVILASKRTRMLLKGADQKIECDNKLPVVSLREIAGGFVRFTRDVEEVLKEDFDEFRKSHSPKVKKPDIDASLI